MNRSSAAPSPFRFALLLLGMMMAALLSACGGGGGKVGLPTGIALYTSAPAGLSLAAGTSGSYTVGGGNPTYSVSTSNKDVATATVSGTTFTITAVGNGTASISVTDAVGASVQVPVTVSGPVAPPAIPPGSLFTTAGGAVTLAVGASANYGIGGGKPAYAVSTSNAAVAKATVSGNNFTVTGAGAGSAQVIVTDADGASLTLEVTVGSIATTVDLYTTAPNNVTVAVGAVGGYLVGGGKPAYAVSSSNAGVAKVAINGTSFTITGMAAGSAQVVVFDSTGDSIEIAVTIGSVGPVVALFTTAPDDVRIAVGATAIYAIGGGKAPYAVSTSNAAVARVAINGADFIITGVASGTAQVAVFDASGDSQTVTVTIGTGGAATPLYTTAASSLTLAVGGTETYAIGGGKPAYAVSSSNSGLVKATLNGTDFTLTGMAAGTAQVTVTDTAGATQTIAVSVGTPATVTPLFTTAPGAITLAVNASDDYLVGGGKPPYKVSTSNAAVAKAAIVGGDLTITGIAGGSAQVTITDSGGDALTTSVTVGLGNVALFTTAPGAVNLALGASSAFVASGGKPAYTVSSSDASVASVALNGANFVITGHSAGSARITLGDAAGATVGIDVTVSSGTGQSLFTTAPAAVTVTAGTTAGFSIGGGKPAYTVSTGDASVATVALNGSTFVISGVAAGTAQINVGDANGNTVTIAVTVPGVAAQALFTTAPNAVNVGVGATGSYAVGGGKPAYSATTSNAAVATVALNGTNFVISGVAAGVAQINLFDSTGDKVSVAVTVGAGAGQNLFTTAPGAVSIGVGANDTFTAAGGTPAYSVSTSNAAVASVTLTGSSFVITGVSAGTAQVIVGDATGNTVTIAVTVGSGAGQALYTTAPSAISVGVGITGTYAVGGGKPGYTVSTSNASVATVTLSGTSVAITGVSSGMAQINVGDSTGESVQILVTVGAGGGTPSLYTTAPGAISLGAGASDSYTVAGGRPGYSVSTSNVAVATATLSGTSLIIHGVSSGTAQIKVGDSGGDSVTINVTVGSGIPPSAPALYTTAPGSVTVAFGTTANYAIGGGAGGYVASSSDTSVAAVSIAGTTLTITPVSPGTATVTVFDAAASAVPISVTVTQTAPSAITVLPGEVTGNVGDSLVFLVSGGTPAYKITMSNSSIATVSPSTVNTDGGSFTINMVNVGSTVATIVDAAGKSTTVPITVQQISTVLRLSPSALLVGENYLGAITLNIFGGTGPYRAFTSDQTLSSVSVVGSTLTLAVGSSGNRCIDPVSDDGTYIRFGTFDVTVTAVDSLGASATSVLTIKDNGAGLGSACP